MRVDFWSTQVILTVGPFSRLHSFFCAVETNYSYNWNIGRLLLKWVAPTCQGSKSILPFKIRIYDIQTYGQRLNLITLWITGNWLILHHCKKGIVAFSKIPLPWGKNKINRNVTLRTRLPGPRIILIPKVICFQSHLSQRDSFLSQFHRIILKLYIVMLLTKESPIICSRIWC